MNAILKQNSGHSPVSFSLHTNLLVTENVRPLILGDPLISLSDYVVTLFTVYASHYKSSQSNPGLVKPGNNNNKITVVFDQRSVPLSNRLLYR